MQTLRIIRKGIADAWFDAPLLVRAFLFLVGMLWAFNAIISSPMWG